MGCEGFFFYVEASLVGLLSEGTLAAVSRVSAVCDVHRVVATTLQRQVVAKWSATTHVRWVVSTN